MIKSSLARRLCAQTKGPGMFGSADLKGHTSAERLPVQKGVRRDLFFSAKRKSINEADHTAEFVVNTIQEDRDDEVVLPLAVLASKSSYMLNPIFLWGHAWHGDPEKALGTCLDLNGDDSEVSAVFLYDVEIHNTAATVWKQVAKGTVRAVSIGFLPKKWVGLWSPAEEIEALPPGVREALRAGRIWLVHTEIELIEISQVLIPSNRGALGGAMAASVGSRQEELLQSMTKILEALTIKGEESSEAEPVRIDVVLPSSPEGLPDSEQAEVDLEQDDSTEVHSEPSDCESKVVDLAEYQSMKAILEEQKLQLAEQAKTIELLTVQVLVAGL